MSSILGQVERSSMTAVGANTTLHLETPHQVTQWWLDALQYTISLSEVHQAWFDVLYPSEGIDRPRPSR